MKSNTLKQYLNPYFFLPFLLWCILGAVLLCSYDARSIFFFINQHHSPFMDQLMELVSTFGEAWVIILIGLCFLFQKAHRHIWFFSAAVLCTVLPSLVTQLIKYQVAAPRPMTVFAQASWVHFLPHWDLLHNNSFPSGHTTGAFSFFCLLSSVLAPKDRPWAILFFVCALATAYARVYLAAHFFADIYVGSIIGTLLSFFIFCVLYTIRNLKMK